jgi:hypothetical protein
LVAALIGRTERAQGLDGFGQSLAQDVRFFWRTRRLQRERIAWIAPDRQSERRLLDDAFLGRFADFVEGVAWHEGFACVVMERMWSGFPDPPAFAFFAMRDGEIVAAADFDDWPKVWRAPVGERRAS